MLVILSKRGPDLQFFRISVFFQERVENVVFTLNDWLLFRKLPIYVHYLSSKVGPQICIYQGARWTGSAEGVDLDFEPFTLTF